MERRRPRVQPSKDQVRSLIAHRIDLESTPGVAGSAFLLGDYDDGTRSGSIAKIPG